MKRKDQEAARKFIRGAALALAKDFELRATEEDAKASKILTGAQVHINDLPVGESIRIAWRHNAKIIRECISDLML